MGAVENRRGFRRRHFIYLDHYLAEVPACRLL